MKKLIFGAIAGWIACNLYDAYRQGYYHRAFWLTKHAIDTDNTTLVWKDFYNYVVYDQMPKSISEQREEHFEKITQEYLAKIPRARAMKAEGYSNAEIADHMGLNESSVRILLEADQTPEEIS